MADETPAEGGAKEPTCEQRLARTAVEIIEAVNALPPEATFGHKIQVRIGLHSGPVIAGVIGKERLQYDVWGDTVNVASRMESTGSPGQIHVSEDFAKKILAAQEGGEEEFKVESRGEVDVKGKGKMETYWISRK